MAQPAVPGCDHDPAVEPTHRSATSAWSTELASFHDNSVSPRDELRVAVTTLGESMVRVDPMQAWVGTFVRHRDRTNKVS